MLIDKDIKKGQFVEKMKISWSTMSKINKNEYVSLEIIDRACKLLECQPGDLLEYVTIEDKTE